MARYRLTASGYRALRLACRAEKKEQRKDNPFRKRPDPDCDICGGSGYDRGSCLCLFWNEDEVRALAEKAFNAGGARGSVAYKDFAEFEASFEPERSEK